MTPEPRAGRVNYSHRQFKDLCDRPPDPEDEFDLLAEAAGKSGGDPGVGEILVQDDQSA